MLSPMTARRAWLNALAISVTLASWAAQFVPALGGEPLAGSGNGSGGTSLPPTVLLATAPAPGQSAPAYDPSENNEPAASASPEGTSAEDNQRVNDVGPDDVLPGLPPKQTAPSPTPKPTPSDSDSAPPEPSPSPTAWPSPTPKADYGEGPIIGVGAVVKATDLGVGVAGGSVNSALQLPDGRILAGGREKALHIFTASLGSEGWTTGSVEVCAECSNAWAAALSADGSRAFFAANSPSSLWEQDLNTGKLRRITQVLPAAMPYLGPGRVGAFDAALAPDGSIYIGSYGRLDPLGGGALPGAVLRYNPVTDRVALVGTPHPGALMVRSVAVAPDGTVFAGTSSGVARARLFYLRPGGTSFTEVPLGLAELGSSSVYDLAVVGDYVIGTVGENQGRIVVVDRHNPAAGGRVIDIPGTTHVDVVAPINQHHFVFSARSDGAVYVGNAKTGTFRRIGTPVFGDETRNLFLWADAGATYLRGVTGSGIVWQVPAPPANDLTGWETMGQWDPANVTTASFQDAAGPGETPVQGSLAALDDTALVAGSWKIAIHENGVRHDHYISGEMKTVQGYKDAYYGTTYPNAWVWRVSKDGNAELLTQLDRRYQSRPLSIDVDPSGILIGTRANYGFAGGALNYIPAGNPAASRPIVHVDPLGKGSINVVKHLSTTDALVASSVQAEATSAQEQRASVARINKTTGEVRWRAEFDTKAFMGAAVTPHGVLLAAIGNKTLLLDPETGQVLSQGIGPSTGRLVEVAADAVVFLEHPWLVRMEVRPGGRLLATRHLLPRDAEEVVDITRAGQEPNSLYGIERRGSLLRLEVTPSRVWRTAGQDRYATAAALVSSESTWADTAVIASGSDYPDALAAAPLAAKLNAPVLLTAQSHLPTATRKALERGGFTRAVVVGGPNSISSSVATELGAMGVAVERVGGASRFETAALVAARVCPEQTCPAFVVSGSTFADALSAGAAASKHAGVVLLARGGLPGGQIPWYLNAQRSYIVGGQAKEQLGPDMPKPSAVFAGQDRFATAALVGAEFFPAAGTAMLVSGETFPDALAASGISALEDAPILLATSRNLPGATAGYLGSSQISRIEITGGPNSVGVNAQEAAFNDLSN